MKLRTLPVKRRPVTKGFLKRLSAVTNHRKQRVAATASSDMEIEDGSSKISRALTIIFLIHIVAITLIFVHKKFLDGRALEPAAASVSEVFPEVAIPPRRTDLPRLSTGETGHVVVRGDNYARIASTLGVDEGELRLINQHVDIIPGLVLKVPAKRAATASITDSQVVDTSSGLVDAVDVSAAPRALLIRPNVTRATGEEPVAAARASGKSHVVQNGDSIWRIANRYKVSQDALMKANGISDARKMKIGMKLVIPN